MQYIKTKKALLLEQWNSGFSATPSAATSQAAGFDLFACILVPMVIEPGKSAKIGLGIKLDLEGFAAFLLPTSGGRDYRLKNTVGLIDPDYQGEVIAAVKNTSEEVLVISPMEKIGQLVLFNPITEAKDKIVFEETSVFKASSERGEKGFGQATSRNAAFSTLKEVKPTAQQALSLRNTISKFLLQNEFSYDTILEPVVTYCIYTGPEAMERTVMLYPEQKLIIACRNREPQSSVFIQDFENSWQKELEILIEQL